VTARFIPVAPAAMLACRPRVVALRALTASEEEFPHIFAVRDELPKVADDDIFETILSLVLAGLMRRAPRPCACGTHQ